MFPITLPHGYGVTKVIDCGHYVTLITGLPCSPAFGQPVTLRDLPGLTVYVVVPHALLYFGFPDVDLRDFVDVHRIYLQPTHATFTVAITSCPRLHPIR